MCPKCDRRQPLDADVNVGRRFSAAGHVEILALRRAAADEHRIPRSSSSVRMLVTGES